MTVDVTMPDRSHRLVPINQTSGRLLEVCADRKDGIESDTVRICAVVVIEHGRARAAFDRGDSIDSNGRLHVVLAAPDAFPGGAMSIAVGCVLLTSGAIGGAVIAEGVRSSDGASADLRDRATTAAVGLWLLSGVAALSTGVAVAFAVLDGAGRSE